MRRHALQSRGERQRVVDPEIGDPRLRQAVDGDAARLAATAKRRYPGMGRRTLLNALQDELGRDIACNAAADPLAHPNVRAYFQALPVPPPPGEGCMIAARMLGDELLGGVDDRRSLRIQQIPGQVEHPLHAAFNFLSRARQLTYAGLGLVRGRGADGPVSAGGEGMIRRACELLYEAYRITRAFEMTPPPPMIVAGEGEGDSSTTTTADDDEWPRALPNRERLVGTKWYHAIMGTEPMQPNRLGIGDEARLAWSVFGYVDPHWIPNTVAQHGPGALYTNVAPHDVPGPRWVETWMREGLRGREAFQPPLAPGRIQNMIDELDGAMLDRLAPRVAAGGTDMSRALLSVHEHIGVPDLGLLNIAEADGAMPRGRLAPGPDALGPWQGVSDPGPYLPVLGHEADLAVPVASVLPAPVLLTEPTFPVPPPPYEPVSVARLFMGDGRERENAGFGIDRPRWRDLPDVPGIPDRGGTAAGMWSALEALRLLAPSGGTTKS